MSCRARRLCAAWMLALACGGGAQPEPAGEGLPGETAVTIGRETRLAFVASLAAGPVRRRLSLDAQETVALRLGYGIDDESFLAGAAAATFHVLLDTRDGRRTLVEKRVDPADPRQRHWFDLRIDLAAFSGEPVAVEVSAVPDPGGPAPHVAWSEPIVEGARTGEARPNLLLISIDTLRARNVGTYGYARDTTPFLDAFAEGGTVFEDAMTTSVTTGPAHMSLFTGRYPANHGLRTGYDRKRPEVATAALRFREAGYQTAAFTENGFIVRTRGFGDGFAEYTENRGQRGRAPGEARVTFRQAGRWLERRARPPFFLFVHTYEVHAPFTPPPDYLEHFVEDGHPGPEDPALRDARDAYDREIRFVDDRLRELLGVLEARDLAASTLVVIVSDHGEEFLEHGLFQHGAAVFQEALRVPWMMAGPGVPAGLRVSVPVSLVDVFPTLLALTGQDPGPPGDGANLVPLLRGGDGPGPRTLFAEAQARRRWLRPMVGEEWNPPLVAVRSGDEKFIVHRPSAGEARPPVRYDLGADALERSPESVVGTERELIEALVDEHLRGESPAGTAGGDDDPDSLDPALRERLRLLGYLED